MARTDKDAPQKPTQQRLAATIEQQARSDVTRRLLHSMPAFRAVEEIPEHLQVLLDRLEVAGPRAQR